MKYSLFIFFLVFFACQKKPCGCEPNKDDTYLDLLYTDSFENCLFKGTMGYVSKDIRVFLKNGKSYELYYDKSMGNPKVFTTYTDNRGEIIRMFPVYLNGALTSEMIIELKTGMSDTLKTEISMDGSKRSFKKAWLNGVEKGRLVNIRK